LGGKAMRFCSKCGTSLPDDAGFCWKCGTRAQRVEIGDSIAEAIRTAGREIEAGLKTAGEEIDKAFKDLKEEFAPRTGPFCTKCGKRNPEGAKFCFACGKEIPQASRKQ